MEKFLSKLTLSINNATTFIEQNRNSRNKKLKPWITKGLVISIRKRDAMSRAREPLYFKRVDNEYLDAMLCPRQTILTLACAEDSLCRIGVL
jgi:hypothetical protein